MAERRTIGLRFGAMADSLCDQLAQQGYAAPAPLLKHWEADAEAISRLSVRGIIPLAVATRARKNLLGQIARTATPVGANDGGA